MGRWVTSKGRRIYIPDEGEENPYAKKENKSFVDKKESTKEKASSSVDLSTKGTYKLSGQKIPEDLPRVSDEDAKHNKMVEYKGTKYSTQQVVDWDREKGREYVAGHMYIPHDDLSKGSFFVSKDREMYHSGSDYLNAQSKKKAKSLQDKEESTKQRQITSNKAQADERNNKIKPYYVDQETQIMGEKMSSRGKMIYAKSEEEALSQYKKDYPKGNARIKESKYPEHIKKAQELNKSQANERNGKKDRFLQNYEANYGRKIPQRSQEAISSGKYNKYKQGRAYENAKTVQVNGRTYKVWSDTTYKGTFAEDLQGNVLSISGSGYLSNELSQRKAIANMFGETTFRKGKKGSKKK